MGLPVGEELIAEAEAKLGRRLPEGFRERTKQANGGTAVKIGGKWFELYPVWDPTNRKTVRRSFNNVVRETESLYRALGEFLPEGGVVLGSNAYGDPLILLPDESLVIWGHRTGKTRPAPVIDWE